MSWKRIFVADKQEVLAHEHPENHVHDPEKPQITMFFEPPGLREQIENYIVTNPEGLPESQMEGVEEDYRKVKKKFETGWVLDDGPWPGQNNPEKVGPSQEQIPDNSQGNKTNPGYL